MKYKMTKGDVLYTVMNLWAIMAFFVHMVQPTIARAETTNLPPEAPIIDLTSLNLTLETSAEGEMFDRKVEVVVPDKRVLAVLTAYTSTPDQTDGDPCTTADGTNVCTSKNPTVAANWLPFGTLVKIPALFGDKVFEVHDRMNTRFNGQNRMDIWMDTSKTEARKFGVKRNITIEIYSKSKAEKLAKN